MLLRTRMLVGSSLVTAALAATAGPVEVAFINSSAYWDAGTSPWDQPANLNSLASHLQQLGQRWLPADHSLRVEVLQVDLAGGVRVMQVGVPVRIVTGGADLPRIELRYALTAGGKPVASGHEWVTDLNYMNRLANRSDSTPLFYEKRMLDKWFKDRFVSGSAPG